MNQVSPPDPQGRKEKEGAREAVLVEENIIVRRSAGAQQASMALQVVVELDRVDNIPVHDCACGAVAAPIAVPLGLGEEADMVTLADDDECDLRRDPQFLASIFFFGSSAIDLTSQDS